MESPFENKLTATMYIETILNQKTKEYENIITLDNIIKGPIERMISRVRFPSLSIFSEITNRKFDYGCKNVLTRYPNNSNYYMYEEDIPSVFSYLQSNGYIINTELTKLYKKSFSNDNTTKNNNRTICIIQYTPMNTTITDK